MKSTKIFCDICGCEIHMVEEELHSLRENVLSTNNITICKDARLWDICPNCRGKLWACINEIKKEAKRD